MSDSDINETDLIKGIIPPTIPPVRSDDTDEKNSSSKTSDIKKE